MSNPGYDDFFKHDHDGITEYDNPLPGWWTWLFVLSIFFSLGYVAYYHIGVGPSVEDKYQAEVTAYFEKQLAALGELKGDDQTIVRLMQNEDLMNAMGGLFRGNCAQCHRDDGGGNIGPNLTDEQWKNVKTPADLFTVIQNGIPGTSMPAWGQRLREPQIIILSAYVASIRGSDPQNPKAAEGSRIAPWPTPEELGIDMDAGTETTRDDDAGDA